MGVYGVIIAGWASNSKYAFLGALRSAAQIVSYEIAMGFALINLAVDLLYVAIDPRVRADTMLARTASGSRGGIGRPPVSNSAADATSSSRSSLL